MATEQPRIRADLISALHGEECHWCGALAEDGELRIRVADRDGEGNPTPIAGEIAVWCLPCAAHISQQLAAVFHTAVGGKG
jgi:hypothetical protein